VVVHAALLAYAASPHAVPAPRFATTHRCAVLPTMADKEMLTCDVRKLPNSAIALDIHVPKAVSDEIHLKTLAKLAKSAKLDGFRDGKAPPQAVVAKLGLQKVKEATVEQIVDIGMTQSGVGQRIQTVGEARLPEKLEGLAERYKVGEGIDFTVEVDVYPECSVEESMYKGMAVKVEEAVFNQEAYDKAMYKLRHQHAELVSVGPGVPAVEGNEVLVDMTGFLANPDGTLGAPLPAVAGGENVNVPLAPGKFMPGLVEGLVGAKEGDERQITVTFPPRSSVPQLAGKEAIFKVQCKLVQKRVLAEVPSEEFANTVKPGMTWAELDAKLREGVEMDREERQRMNAHKAITKALVDVLPASFEVPETLVDQATKERFAMMLGDMREQGQSDEKLKELITPENYERYKMITKPMVVSKIKGDFAIKAISQQQGLVVPQDQVDDEIMTLQAQALQRGEKFKESETRPRVQQTLERQMVLDWLQSNARITIVEPAEESVEDILGQSPEQLAAAMKASEPPAPAAPGGFEWGATF